MKESVSSRRGRLSRALCALLALVVLVGVLPVGMGSAYADDITDPAVDTALDPAAGAQTPAPAEKVQRKVEATDTTNGVYVGVEGVMPADASLVLKTLSDEALSWLRAGRTLAEDEFFLVYSLCLVTPDGAELEVVPGESEYKITVYFTAKDKCFAPDLAVAALGGTLGALETDAANDAAEAAHVADSEPTTELTPEPTTELTPEPADDTESAPTPTQAGETPPTDAADPESAPAAPESTDTPAAEPAAAPETDAAPAEPTPAAEPAATEETDTAPTEPEPIEPTDPSAPAESEPAPNEPTEPSPAAPEKPSDVAIGPVFNGASYAVFTANALGIFKFTGTSYFASDPAEPAEPADPDPEPTDAPEVLAASAGDFAFAARGALPAGAAALSVSPIEAEQDELAEALSDFGVELDGEGTIFAFDIKLLDALGAELQPVDGEVEISVSGLPTDVPLRVIHQHDDAPAAMSMDAADAAPAVPVEELPCALTGDTLTFSTTGFSNYYIVSGYATYESGSSFTATDDIILMSEVDGDTLYVAPGTTLCFASGTWKNTMDKYSWWKVDNYSSGNHITTVRFKDDGSFTSSWSGYTKNDRNDHLAEVKVSRDAIAGEKIVLYNCHSWICDKRDYQPYNSTAKDATSVTIIVMDEMNIVNHTFDNTKYPVRLTILADASKGTPSEPSMTQLSYYYAKSVTDVLQLGSYGNFANTANEVIYTDRVLNNPNLLNSADGTATMGIVRQNGVEPKDYLKGIDWDTLLKTVATNRSPIATDGKTVDKSNYTGYEIVPYVIKLQTANSIGWHIDCYIAPKNNITLNYVANLASGYEISNLNLPDAVSGTGAITDTVGYAKQGSDNINVNKILTCMDSSKTVTFTGWNTAPDGTGAAYAPGVSITVAENTTLYAQWTYSPELTSGTLKVQKVVNDPDNKLADQEFTMKLNVTGLTGKRYDSTGKLIENDISSDSFKLKAGQYALFSLPKDTKVTVTETSTGNYTATYSNNPVTIKQGATSTITVTNTYEEPAPEDITVTVKKTVSGTAGDKYKSFTLKVGYKSTQDGAVTWLNEDDQTFKVGDTPKTYTVPSGSYLVIEETDAAGYTMTARFGASATAISATGTTVTSPTALTANTDVTVNNHKDGTPDTGVDLDALPYALALAVAAVGAAMLLARPCRRRE